jgi:hypothetical protein
MIAYTGHYLTPSSYSLFLPPLLTPSFYSLLPLASWIYVPQALNVYLVAKASPAHSGNADQHAYNVLLGMGVYR